MPRVKALRRSLGVVQMQFACQIIPNRADDDVSQWCTIEGASDGHTGYLHTVSLEPEEF